MRKLLLGAMTAAALAGPLPALAQQGWTPVVTPIEAKTQPLPKLRGPLNRSTPEPPTQAQPVDRAQLPIPPPASPERRSGVRDPAPGLPVLELLPVRADAPPAQPAQQAQPLETPLARGYCANIGTLAGDAKFAWQKKAIGELAQELEERIAKLEAKTKEYQVWLARRDEFSKRVTDNLVVIYSRMRPEAAGQQLMAMDEETAAAVLMKLDPRIASSILNDMNAQHAARLTSIISGAGKVTPSPAQPPANKPATPENRKS